MKYFNSIFLRSLVLGFTYFSFTSFTTNQSLSENIPLQINNQCIPRIAISRPGGLTYTIISIKAVSGSTSHWFQETAQGSDLWVLPNGQYSGQWNLQVRVDLGTGSFGSLNYQATFSQCIANTYSSGIHIYTISNVSLDCFTNKLYFYINSDCTN